MDWFSWLHPASAAWLPTLGAALIALLIVEVVFRVGDRVPARSTGSSPAGTAVRRAVHAPARLLLALLVRQPVFEHPFQTWMRTSSELIGTVFLWVDCRLPLAPLRAQLQRVCEASKHRDRRFRPGRLRLPG